MIAGEEKKKGKKDKIRSTCLALVLDCKNLIIGSSKKKKKNEERCKRWSPPNSSKKRWK
jgi:hypothetical protein